MNQLVRRKENAGKVLVECVHNRELTEEITDGQRFFYLSPLVHDHFGVDQVYGEILIYSPNFRKDIGSAWVGTATDFESVS